MTYIYAKKLHIYTHTNSNESETESGAQQFLFVKAFQMTLMGAKV